MQGCHDRCDVNADPGVQRIPNSGTAGVCHCNQGKLQPFSATCWQQAAGAATSCSDFSAGGGEGCSQQIHDHCHLQWLPMKVTASLRLWSISLCRLCCGVQR